MFEAASAANAFAQTLWTTRKGRSRRSFEKWQANQMQVWLHKDLRRVPFYSTADPHLASLPIVDKSLVMSQFENFNLGHITAQNGWHAIDTTGEINGVNIGASTGTSGNRTLYAVTKREQFRWLGTILAKTVPGFLWAPERVAVLLPQVSVLYDNANKSKRIKLQFFDLGVGPEHWLPTLERFNPTTIVAPPRVLRHLAERSQRLAPRSLYAGGETLDLVDRDIIEARFGLTLGQIYMASEGLFAVSCRHGSLHLAEDANHFEFESVGDSLVSPLITSFQRRFQIIARYRMNDLLRLSKTADCACGSPLRVVDEIIGRMDDVFVFQRKGQSDILVTPDTLRNAVLNSAKEISDFRIQRVSANKVVLTLQPDVPNNVAMAAKEALANQFQARNLTPSVTIERRVLTYKTGPKLRRVENCYRGKDTLA